MRKQRPHDPDMGETARGSTAKRKPNDRPPPATEADLIAVVGFAGAASYQSLKHLTDSLNILAKNAHNQTMRGRNSPPQ
jgi:hypothetical protein